MAITLEGTPNVNTGDSTDFTVNVPTVSGGVLADDWIVVVVMHCESEDNTWALPSWADAEWLTELQVGQTPPSIPGVQVFAELATGGETGARASTDGDFAAAWSAISFVVRGVDTTTPLDVTVTTVQSSSTGQPNPPSITPTNDDCLILAIGIKDQAVTTAQTVSTWPTNYTDLQQEANNNINTGGLLAVAGRILSGGAASAEDPSEITGSLGVDEWAGATIALRPGPTIAREQEGYRFRDDDADEDEATWLAAQDTNVNIVKQSNVRLRILSNMTDDAPNESITLEYRQVGDASTEWRIV